MWFVERIIGIYTLFFKKIMIDDNGGIQYKVFKTHHLFGIFSVFFTNLLNPRVFIFLVAATTKVHSQALQQLHLLRHVITVYTTYLLFLLSADIAKVLLPGKLDQDLRHTTFISSTKYQELF